jgi:hypothetical protein
MRLYFAAAACDITQINSEFSEKKIKLGNRTNTIIKND